MPLRPATRPYRLPHPGWILLAALCACQPQPTGGPRGADLTTPGEGWPGHDYEASALAGKPVFELDRGNTQIEIVVRREGPLARFGHDHVVTLRDPEGFLELDGRGSGVRADLRFPVARLLIDSEEARERLQLATEPDAQDIEGTRNNLMEHVLDADHWPWASLTMTSFRHRDDRHSALVGIAVRGSGYSEVQPFRLSQADGRVVVEGFFLLRQTELGLEPFSALGGGLRVADAMEVHFRIEAVRY